MHKLKKLLLISLSCVTVLGLSGCAGKSVPLVNPSQSFSDLGERNKQVITDLYIQGLISQGQYEKYLKSIDVKLLEYISVMDSTLKLEDTNLSDAEIDGIKKNYEQLKGWLTGAVVDRFGNSNDGSISGVVKSKHGIDGCDNEFNALSCDDLFEIDDIDIFKYLVAGDSSSEMKPKSDSNVVPLKIVDENSLSSLLNEINGEIYVLDETKVNAENWNLVLEKINDIKQDPNPSEDKYKSIISSYFKKSGYTAYNFTTDDILVNSTPNDGIGEEKFTNSINKDYIISGVLSGKKHITKTETDSAGNKTESCVKEEMSKTVGVYSFRVNEFREDFANIVSKSIYTNSRYISVKPTGVNEKGILLLMEYPVSVISSLSTDNINSSDWKFDFQDTGMKINIYTGEMLMMDEDGKYQKINSGEDDDILYRVFGENIGLNIENGKSVSFIPIGVGTVGSNDLALQTENYSKVKLLSLKNGVGSEKAYEYGIELNTPYPYLYLYHDDITCKIDGYSYKLRDKSDSDNEVLTLKGKKYLYRNNSETYMNIGIIDTWTKLWNLFDKYYTRINSSDIKPKEEYSLYKIYTALKDNGQIKSDNDIKDWFTSAVIYSSLEQHFGEEFIKLQTDYDKKYTQMRKIQQDFEYSVPEDDGTITNGVYSCLTKYWEDGRSEEVRDIISGLGGDYLNLYESIIKDNDAIVGSIYSLSDLVEFSDFESDDKVDSNIGKEIELDNNNRDRLYFSTEDQLWVFKYINNNSYFCRPLCKDVGSIGNTTNISEISTVKFALKEYLELTYMPGVITEANMGVNEDFIATGRRIKIEKFSGTGDDEVGYYADKMGDPIKLGDDEEILYIKVSDIIDYTSGIDEYYSGIAKGLAFNGNRNEDRINKELLSKSVDRLKTLFVGTENEDENDTGLIGDKQLLSYTIYQTKINPVLRFTSSGDENKPSLDACDIDNSDVPLSLYYGLCVNTNAYKSGLYTKWIDYEDPTGVIGSLSWWNSWLGSHGYNYEIDIDKLKNVMKGVYAASLAAMDNTIIFDSNTLKVINEEITEEKYEQTTSIVRTFEVLVGAFLLVYGFMMMACWLIDTNLVNGPGFLTIITGGRFVAIRDASEIPRMSDGKVYTDFKYLLVVTIMLMVLGIILIVFDIKMIWTLVYKLFAKIIDIFKNLMLNR